MRSNINEIRSLNDERLVEEETNTQRELLNLRFKLATRQLASAEEFRTAKTRLAQIKTVRRERELARGQA